MDDIPIFNPKWGKPVDRRRQRREEKGTQLGWKWWRLRGQYLTHFPYCAKCELLGTEVHHIQPRSKRPDLTYDLRNLMTLCSQCHREIHANDLPEQPST